MVDGTLDPAGVDTSESDPNTPKKVGITDPGQGPQKAPLSTRDAIMALYQKHGIQPGGAGSGFADLDYWANSADNSADKGWAPYWDERLDKDLSGTGTDRSTGTPGQGAWASSGQGGNAGGASGGALNLFQSNWTPDPRNRQLYDKLMGRADQSLQIDRNDPIIRNQADAFGAQQERERRNYLRETAEQGGANTNMQVERRASASKAAQANSGFTASLMGRELTARRQEIQDALTQMGSLLSDEQRMQLQHQLALMDNTLGQASLGQRGYEFDVNDEFRRSPLAPG